MMDDIDKTIAVTKNRLDFVQAASQAINPQKRTLYEDTRGLMRMFFI